MMGFRVYPWDGMFCCFQKISDGGLRVCMCSRAWIGRRVFAGCPPCDAVFSAWAEEATTLACLPGLQGCTGRLGWAVCRCCC